MSKTKTVLYVLKTIIKLWRRPLDAHEFQVEIATCLLHEAVLPEGVIQVSKRDELKAEMNTICNMLTEYGVYYGDESTEDEDIVVARKLVEVEQLLEIAKLEMRIADLKRELAGL